MDAKVETLCDNEWVSLKKLVDPDNFINGYVYSHETRCKGKIISVIPFRFVGSGDNKKLELLLRKETTPCWHRLRKITSSITGGMEKTAESTAVQELWEEAGYKVKEDDLILLGYCFASKSSDTEYTLFTINLTGKEKEGEAKGDGSKLEELAHCEWMDESIVTNVWDPLVSVMFVRLLNIFKEEANAKD